MKSFSTAVNGVEERPFTNADTNFLQFPSNACVRLMSASPNDWSGISSPLKGLVSPFGMVPNKSGSLMAAKPVPSMLSERG